MSVAERTRRAVRDDPSLYDALGAGVLNYSAAARSLDVEGDEESIATALRRFADELEAPERIDRRVSVRLHRGVALDDGTDDGGTDIESTDLDDTDVDSTDLDDTDVDSTDLDGTDVDSTELDGTDVDSTDLDGTDVDSTVDDGEIDGGRLGGVALDEDGDAAAIEASGDVDALALEGILGRLRARDVEVHAAGVANESLLVAVPSRSGAEALRVVEAALEGA